MDNFHREELMKKFKSWLDAESKGRLLVLPVADGEAVFAIDGFKIFKVLIIGVEKSYAHNDGLRFIGVIDDDSASNFYFDLSCIGKTVFLTQAEADHALLNSPVL